MKKNMNSTDRIIRTLVAAVIITLYLTKIISGTLGLVLIALAAVFLLTSFISSCPIYSILGLSSFKKERK